MLALYVLPLVAQLVTPLALLVWLWFAPGRSHASSVLRIVMTTAYVVAIALAGLWLIVPWFLSVVYLVIVVLRACTIPRRRHSLPRWPQRRLDWLGFALTGILAIAFVGLAGTALRARWPPREQIVELEFPLRDGTYAVANGKQRPD